MVNVLFVHGQIRIYLCLGRSFLSMTVTVMLSQMGISITSQENQSADRGPGPGPDPGPPTTLHSFACYFKSESHVLFHCASFIVHGVHSKAPTDNVKASNLVGQI